jgi:hypothetical protein
MTGVPSITGSGWRVNSRSIPQDRNGIMMYSIIIPAIKPEQVFNTNYEFPFPKVTGGDGESENKRNLFSAKSDLKLKMKKKFTLETGLKASFLWL